jgi:DNA-directed RNA polymerase III subunit RPC2
MEDVGILVGTELYDPKAYLIYINGVPMGVHRNPEKFVADFKVLRRKGKFISIYVQHAKPHSKMQSAIHIA